MRSLAPLCLAVALLLVAAGCGSDDTDTVTGEPQPVATTGSPSSSAEPSASEASAGSALTEKDGLVVVDSEFSVAETTSRLTRTLEDNGLLTVATVDHSANAEKADLQLPPTMLVIFGNPMLGTPLMQAQRTVAIDLPQKMLVWEDAGGEVQLAYNDPAYLADRHGIDSEDEVLDKVSMALEMLAEAATAGG